MIRACLLFHLLTAHGFADPPKLDVDGNGRWKLALRYWAHCTPFQSAGGYAFLAEVAQLGAQIPPVEEQDGPLRFRSGILKVREVLNPKPAPALTAIKELSVEGLDGLKIGDRLIVFVDPVAYEGGYVINFHDGGCHVGIRLPPANDLDFGAGPQAHILKALRDGRFELWQLSDEEIFSWIIADAAGIARRFQVELEKKHLLWNKEAEIPTSGGD